MRKSPLIVEFTDSLGIVGRMEPDKFMAEMAYRFGSNKFLNTYVELFNDSQSGITAMVVLRGV